MKYVFFIKNPRTKNYKIISDLLIFFNLLGFVFLFVKDEAIISNNYWLFLSIFITAAYMFFVVIEWLLKKPMADFWRRIIFLYCALSWLNEGIWWLFLLLLLFTLLDVLTHRKLIITITENKITLPSLPIKSAGWNELNNLVLKDDLLTIDFKNNKLFQHLIFYTGNEIDEGEFNTFCSQRILNS